MRLRDKALGIFTALSLVPVLGAVALLIDVNRVAVKDSERMLQDAALVEVVDQPERLVRDGKRDARAVAVLYAQGATGTVKDDDIEALVTALLKTQAAGAVRIEVPAASYDAVVPRKTPVDVPKSTPELRKAADEQGVAFGVTAPPGAPRGVIVARIPPAPDGKGVPGYVVMGLDLSELGGAVSGVVERRFGGSAAMLITTRDKRAVASFGMGALAPGASVADHPMWTRVSADAAWRQRVGVVMEFTSGDTKMVGALQTDPDLDWAVAVWRPEPVAYAALDAMRRQGVAVALGAVLLALLAGFFTARGVTAPILKLVEQARLIGKRRWREVALGSTRADEIGELERSLGQMSGDLEKGEVEIAREAKLRGDLGRFVSKPLVDAIVRGEHPLSLGGKRAMVSVVFADVVGFTPLSESHEAEKIVALLNELFSVLSEIVFRHEGTVDKFMGDCIMAVWGAPVAQEDHARRALAAAEDMMRFLETANEGWKEKYDVEIRLGIGVNSGEAIVGNIGSDKRMEYTVIGDVVNVAARLEAIAQPNQVLVAEATRELAGDAFVFQKLGARRLTGRKNETSVYALETE